MKCEIEANISCGDCCQQKVRSNLECIRGVESVELYPEIKKVVVRGKFKPDILLSAVKEVKRSAQIITVEASRPANNSGVVSNEYGDGHDQKNKKTKKKAGSVVAPVDEEPTCQETTVDYFPVKPSETEGNDGIASEATTYALNLTAYGFGGGISYRKDVTYK